MIDVVPWIDLRSHSQWLNEQTDRLLRFYSRGAADFDAGGFWWVDSSGNPDRSKGKQLWINARLTYAFSVGVLLGRPECVPLVEHGLRYLSSGPLRDGEHGGWYWSIDEHDAVQDSSKQAYGHAFVLLAAAAGGVAGFATEALQSDVLDVLERRFWDVSSGLYVDTWDRTFSTLSDYRGQNANMHLVESLMALSDVTGVPDHRIRADGIARRLIGEHARSHEWRLPEHFDTDWQPELEYGRGSDDAFRPYGSTVGHLLEWCRLLVQLHLSGSESEWALAAARSLFDRAIADGWDTDATGFAFSTDWRGVVVDGDRYHWVDAEAIGAAVALHRATGDRRYDDWYRRFWEHATRFHIDPVDGSWAHQLGSTNQLEETVWDGRPDLYHALQATLFARVPSAGSLIQNLALDRLDRLSVS